MGSLSGISGYSIVGNLILCIICATVLFALHRQVIRLSAEEGEARMLGVNVGVLRLIILLVPTLVVASVVSLTGLISFFGLLAPLLLLSDGKVIGTIYPHTDPLDKMELMLRKVYGAISLQVCSARSGRSYLVILKEDL